jgi:hypothetical protein
MLGHVEKISSTAGYGVAILSAWTFAIGAHHERKGERLAATGDAPGPSHVHPSSPRPPSDRPGLIRKTLNDRRSGP